MAGAAPVRQSSRRRAKADAEKPPQPPALPTSFKPSPTSPSERPRTVGATRALKGKGVSSPAAKKNLQQLFRESPPERPPRQWLLGDKLLLRAFLLFVVISAVITTLWKMRDRSSAFPEMPTPGKLSEVEEFMRKTSNWLQGQIDMVDDKITKEVYVIRAELEEKMSRRSQSLEADLKATKALVDSLDNSVRTLYSEELLSRDETLQLIKAAMEHRSPDNEAVTLDAVRLAARNLVQHELDRHAADGIGRVDYALLSGGGKVVHHSEGYLQGLHWTKLGVYAFPGVFRRHPLADKVLSPSFGEPGQCLPLKGSNVTVDIRLRSHIHPRAVTLEHLSRRVAYDVRSAPKDFRVFGWSERSAVTFGAANSTLLGESTYNFDDGSIQTFDLESSGLTGPVNMIRLHVLSNHGSPTHTCIYRLRVHGSEAL